VTDLPQHYGPIVRVGPNRVLFRNVETIQTIYGTHDFRKSSWYSTITFSGAQNTLSTGYDDGSCGCAVVYLTPLQGSRLSRTLSSH